MGVDTRISRAALYPTCLLLWISVLRRKTVRATLIIDKFHDFSHFTGFLVSQCFKYMRAVQKRGPLVNSEFYSGWLTHWRESIPIVNADEVVRVMKDMLALNASINIYMFHGGTNFGFTSGANKYEKSKNPEYLPQITSYDYDAPLDEAGDPTEKYFKIKNVLEEYVSFNTNKYNCTYDILI